MRSFIVRPFGVKSGIDFDRVETELIAPALKEIGFAGGTTAELIAQGNIRTDMFEQLLIADLVIADISIHNANAFYELGIRHAFRDKRTFLIRSRGDDVPFDLKTDRYMSYDAAQPEESLADLIDRLKSTLDSQSQDSPVFQLLPGLKPTNPKKFLITPSDFTEDLEQAKASKNIGMLQLLAAEVEGFPWKTVGLRPIAKAQRALRNWQGARETWEAVRNYNDLDLEANTQLGTLYQREGNLFKSDQALNRALQSPQAGASDRAQIYALMGKNAKTLWEQDWQHVEIGIERQRAALLSPQLLKSFEFYNRGYVEDRNHVYSALNALAMLTIMLELLELLPDEWEDGFESEAEARYKIEMYREMHTKIAAGTGLALESEGTKLEKQGIKDQWNEISKADLIFLSSRKPKRVGRAYKSALSGADDFAVDSAQAQLLFYQSLDIRGDFVKSALETMPEIKKKDAGEKPPRVVFFTGHRIDQTDRATPRFPAAAEAKARDLIKQAVAAEHSRANGNLIGISGGASGGDILFHEVCEELGITTNLYLTLPKRDYIKSSVADAGQQWIERYKQLCEKLSVRVLSQSEELPRWLRTKENYNIWQRASLWKLYNALAISHDNVSLLALWDGLDGDGDGGTGDTVARAKERGATFIHLDSTKLLD